MMTYTSFFIHIEENLFLQTNTAPTALKVKSWHLTPTYNQLDQTFKRNTVTLITTLHKRIIESLTSIIRTTKQNVKLLGTGVSPFEWRIIWVLKWKGIEFEFVQEDVCNKSPPLFESNPVSKMIPVLIHGQNAISLVILDYIDDTWKYNPILPDDPMERAYARFWARFSEEKILEPSRLAFHYTGSKQATGVKLMAKGIEILEGEIKGRKFFGGDHAIGYLDFVAGWIAYWLHFSDEALGYKVMDSTKYPLIDRWIKTFLQVDIVKDNLPPFDEMLSTYKMYS